MTLMTYINILCDYCGEESDYRQSAREARQAAKGWIRKNKKDMCPECAKKHSTKP